MLASYKSNYYILLSVFYKRGMGAELCAQGHSANKWQAWDLNPGGFVLESMLLATMLCYHLILRQIFQQSRYKKHHSKDHSHRHKN